MRDTTWPTCTAHTSGVYGVVLSCVLPAHHDHDGDPWHHDHTGARWQWRGPSLTDDVVVVDAVRRVNG